MVLLEGPLYSIRTVMPSRLKLRDWTRLPLSWVLPAALATSSYAQAAPPSIQFTNSTAAAGITFAHFKGNKGISINREEFGPGIAWPTSTATAGRTFTL